MSSWTSPLSDEQSGRIAALERACACPVLTAANAAAAGSADNREKKSADGKDDRAGSLRDWYLACADEPPPESPLVKLTIKKVIKTTVEFIPELSLCLYPCLSLSFY